jgi:hypothetical protein
MHQQAFPIAEAENVKEMDSPEAMKEDQLRDDEAPSGEDEAQYE